MTQVAASFIESPRRLPGASSQYGQCDGLGRWLEMPFLPAGLICLFGEGVSLACELIAMARLGLGTLARSEEERVDHQKLKILFAEKRDLLVSQVGKFDSLVRTEVLFLFDNLCEKHVDFAAEAQAESRRLGNRKYRKSGQNQSSNT